MDLLIARETRQLLIIENNRLLLPIIPLASQSSEQISQTRNEFSREVERERTSVLSVRAFRNRICDGVLKRTRTVRGRALPKRLPLSDLPGMLTMKFHLTTSAPVIPGRATSVLPTPSVRWITRCPVTRGCPQPAVCGVRLRHEHI